MTALFLVWYASGWANVALNALAHDCLNRKDFVLMFAWGPILISLYIAFLPFYALFVTIFNDEIIWQKNHTNAVLE